MSINKMGVVTNITSAMNVKHHPRPMVSIIKMITAVWPAPRRQRQRLFAAVTVAGEVGSIWSQYAAFGNEKIQRRQR